jgi:hypothetical protein
MKTGSTVSQDRPAVDVALVVVRVVVGVIFEKSTYGPRLSCRSLGGERPFGYWRRAWGINYRRGYQGRHSERWR